MASRSDYRRRERSWEREDRDRERDRDRHHKGGRGREDGRKRSSRSRSPRRSDRDKRDYRRERGEKDYRRKEDGRDREREHKHERRTTSRREDDKRHEDPHSRDPVLLDSSATPAQTQQPTNAPVDDPQPKPDRITDEGVPEEEGEEMDVVNDDEAAAMASIMGMNGFGTTKGKQVVGNQEGAVNIKKIRTWRQYMNRRGGFNRPLDKIK